VECWYDYSTSVLESGDVLEALRGFNECTRLMPEWAEGYYATAKTLCAAGQPLSAVPFLNKAFALDPSKRDDYEAEFPLIAGPLGMEYLNNVLKEHQNGE
jgi:tetratricopeptide (TPR) repeat protein